MSNLPTIRFHKQELPAIIDEAEQHLIAANDILGVYQRDGKLVRVGQFPTHGGKPFLEFVPLIRENIVELLTAIIIWERQEAQKLITTGCPTSVAAGYLGRTGQWRVPTVRQIITCPTMRPDGSILDQPGYDKATGLFYQPQGVEFSPIPEHPTHDDAMTCLDCLKSVVAEVPFVVDDEHGQVSRSVFLSAVLSALARAILPAVPLHGFSAPAPGSGKSILVNGISYLMTGNPCDMLAQSNSEEMGKILSSALQAGNAIIAFDNCEDPLGGAMLCQAVSEPYLSVRVFGKTELKKITNAAVYFATGNNLTFTGDITRRAMKCAVDAQCERPEMRTFKTPRPDLAMKKNRADLVVAGLTILRAYVVAGRPSSGLEPVGTFEAWSRLVRDCLIWLGEPDPWLSTEQIRGEDPIIGNNIAALQAWFDTFGSDKKITKDVIEAAFSKTEGTAGSLAKFKNPALQDALRVVTDNNLNSQTLGSWLRGLKDRPFGGFTVRMTGKSNGNNHWQVISATESGIRQNRSLFG